jgi:mono/diheme cytochrome c family protein
VIVDSLPLRIVVSLSAAALPVVAFVVGVSSATGAPAPMRPVPGITAAASGDSASYRRRARAPSTGEEIFLATCAACHGADGRGAPQGTVGFAVPLPNFTDCYATSPEMEVDWRAVIRDGGPVRSFSRIMPAFRDLLTPQQIRSVAAYLRTFCRNPRWPRGDFNVAFSQVVEKAFPEDELVLTSAASTRAPGSVENHIIFEKRFWIRTQLEVDIPVVFVERPGASWAGGLGDVSVTGKQVLVANVASGTIVSALAGIIVPTGDMAAGFGTGTTAFEAFILGAQLLPARGYFQYQAGVELPTDPSRLPRSAFWGGTLGTSIPFGRISRIWSPMIGVTGTRDLVSGAPVDWNVVPEVQLTLSALQHVRASVGLNVPVTQRDTRSTQLLAYVLWDMADGPLFQGWKGWCPGCEH